MRIHKAIILAVLLAGCATKPETQPGAVTDAQPMMISQAPTYSVPVRWHQYDHPVTMLKVWVGRSTGAMNVAAITGWQSTGVIIGGLKKNMTYFFKITAVDTNGLESADSAIVSYNSKQGGAQAPAGSVAE